MKLYKQMLLFTLLLILTQVSCTRQNTKAANTNNGKQGRDFRSYTDSSNRTIEIPVQPKRIISLSDHFVSLPLLDLGAKIAGSQGRVDKDKNPFMRSVRDILGISYENANIEFIGTADAIDFEKTAAIKPDLIVLLKWQEEMLPKLEKIAPTVLLDDGQANILDYFKDLADVSGTLSDYKDKMKLYNTLIDKGKTWLRGREYIYGILEAWDGKIFAYQALGVLHKVLDDLGFKPSKMIKDMRSAGKWQQPISAEVLNEQEADFVFGTYIDFTDGYGPLKSREEWQTLMKNYCKNLKACAQGQLIIMPRSYISPSFGVLNMNVHYIS